MAELDVGSKTPDFTLPASSGGDVALADYRGRATVVLFFVREFS